MTKALNLETIKVAQAKLKRVAPLPLPPMKFIPTQHMTVTDEDWSDVRSPSRAERRRKQGHPQRIRYVTRPDPTIIETPDGWYAHPETLKKLQEKLHERGCYHQEKMFNNLMFGVPL
jgi:hypothetical protein